ncbi:MAG TPA: S-layer homology domain-containing protein, partial [Clostridium sp.]|nr:S-layer homology domain-containing protein [Clostridium sp.]
PGTGEPGTGEPGTGGNPGGGDSGGGNPGGGNPNDPKEPDDTSNTVTDPAQPSNPGTNPTEPSNPVTDPTTDIPTSGKNNKAYIRGYSDNTFRPEQSITRAEMAVILANLDGASKDNQTGIEFKDVPKEHWAAWAIAYVAEKGYFKGYEDGTYKPDRYITRAELCVVLGNYMKMDLASVDENELMDIKGHWAQNYINTLISKGYVKGYPDGTFRPNNNIKRSECVTLINRVLGIEAVSNAEPYFTDVDKSYWAFGDIMAAILNN